MHTSTFLRQLPVLLLILPLVLLPYTASTPVNPFTRILPLRRPSRPRSESLLGNAELIAGHDEEVSDFRGYEIGASSGSGTPHPSQFLRNADNYDHAFDTRSYKSRDIAQRAEQAIYEASMEAEKLAINQAAQTGDRKLIRSMKRVPVFRYVDWSVYMDRKVNDVKQAVFDSETERGKQTFDNLKKYVKSLQSAYGVQIESTSTLVTLLGRIRRVEAQRGLSTEKSSDLWDDVSFRIWWLRTNLDVVTNGAVTYNKLAVERHSPNGIAETNWAEEVARLETQFNAGEQAYQASTEEQGVYPNLL